MSNKQGVTIDYKKLLLSKPDGLFELFALVFLIACTFAFYFAPLTFSKIEPTKAIMMSIVPAFISGWGLFTLVRLVRYKKKYTK
ncbi:MAG: hypothetical protein ACK5NF_04425 [Bacilli bacterium]